MERRFELTPGFLAVICLLAWVNLQMCGRFCLCVLVHELGHGAAMAACRVPIRRVSLRISGAVIEGGFRGYGQELLCAVAGPAAGALLAALVYQHAPELAIVSVCLTAVNLLPLYPLDGGRILRAALLLRLEEGRVQRLLSACTFVTYCLLMLGVCWLTVWLQAGVWPMLAALVILWRVGTARWPELR